jgi:hypothetical protein
VRHRVPADLLLLVTVVLWSFNFTVCNFTYRPYALGVPRWESQAAARPSAAAALIREQRAAMLTVAVQEYIADVRPVFGERTA